MAGPPSPVIACAGDIGVDWLVLVDRLPSTDDKMTARALMRRPGGMAANVAVALRRLGGESRLIGRVGADDEGRDTLAHLEREGIDLRHVSISPADRTFQCLVFVGPGGERALVRLPSDLALPAEDDIDAAALVGCGHLHLTFGAPGLVAHAAALARPMGISLSIDLEAVDLPDKPDALARLLGSVDVAFLNRRARSAVDQALDLRGFACAIVTTLGADGARFEHRGQSIDSPGQEIRARDTTGAGDAFAAAFLTRWLVDRRDPRSALDFANLIAARSTRGVGAQAALPGSAGEALAQTASIVSRMPW